MFKISWGILGHLSTICIFVYLVVLHGWPHRRLQMQIWRHVLEGPRPAVRGNMFKDKIWLIFGCENVMHVWMVPKHWHIAYLSIPTLVCYIMRVSSCIESVWGEIGRFGCWIGGSAGFVELYGLWTLQYSRPDGILICHDAIHTHGLCLQGSQDECCADLMAPFQAGCFLVQYLCFRDSVLEVHDLNAMCVLLFHVSKKFQTRLVEQTP